MSVRRRCLACVALAGLVLPATSAAADSATLEALFDREWEWRLEANPLLATSVGVHRHDDRLPDMRPDAIERRAATTREFLDELHDIDRDTLDRDERIDHEIFERQLEQRLVDVEFGAHQIPITSESGFHTAFARLPDEMRFRTRSDYDDYLTRLGSFPTYVDRQIQLMRAGLERGMTLPRVVLDGLLGTVEAHTVDDVETSVFWEPFTTLPVDLSADEAERLLRAAPAAIERTVDGYRRFADFLRREYIPGARTSLGASELPDGDAYYAALVRRYTTLETTPEQIHRTGLDEVERIRAEMRTVVDSTGFDGSLTEFIEMLRTDDRFYVDEPRELLEAAAWIAKRMDGALPRLFNTLPRQPYTVAPVPDELAPTYTAGRYVGAPPESDRPGTYWVNTHDLDSRPLYALEALTFHEAVPGHHLQNALAQEQEDLPAFRRHSYISAFGEGWGLYSEWLGVEAGFYDDPYSEFGRLTYEMWRACRLVVDTGIHAMGWTRQRAVDYLASRTALSMHEVNTEIDRYISWPGQALAYKMGELTIKRLRRRAEEALGSAFDVGEFHDVVLLEGSVPLPILEENVDRWIASRADEGQRGAGPPTEGR